MSLSEIIAKLDTNESIKFSSTHQSTAIRVVIKKGDHPKNNKTHQFFVDTSVIEDHSRAVDVLAFEVDRALQIIRKNNV